MVESKVLRRRFFQIRPFKYVILGDPMYLEEIKSGTERRREFVFNQKVPFSGRYAKVCLEEEAWGYDGLSGRSWVLKFFSAKKGAQARSVEEELFSLQIHSKRIKKLKELGCDTGSFLMAIDENDGVINLGGDGTYGFVIQCEEDLAFFFDLSFPGDLFTEEDMLSYISYFFEVTNSDDWEIISPTISAVDCRRQESYLYGKNCI